MKRLLYLLAAVAMVFTACKKEEVNGDDLIGVWEDTNENTHCILTFYRTGDYTKTMDDFTEEGTWRNDKGNLTLLAKDETRMDYTVRLLGGKAALVLHGGDEESAWDELYYKKGATVQSGALKDGRYDAPHNGVKGTGNYDRTVTFIVKGNQLDLYVHAWGTHLQGTYKIENGYLKFNAT
ncbi:MAG: hypothetical protein J5769_06465, partial [Bacteroidales bacterium]|nr:hypothetical protein [Bacteroidales bacterium]